LIGLLPPANTIFSSAAFMRFDSITCSVDALRSIALSSIEAKDPYNNVAM
jgi:hypothetical protein